MKWKFGKEYDICPQTYIFPEDYKKFHYDRDEEKKNVLYIIKPSASSCGRGIKVISKNTHIGKKQGCVISKYVHKPLLINGFKFDIRLYVLVTSYDPLKIYLYQDGLVWFATEKYTTSSSSLKKRFIHLTNYSVNKKNMEKYVINEGEWE